MGQSFKTTLIDTLNILKGQNLTNFYYLVSKDFNNNVSNIIIWLAFSQPFNGNLFFKKLASVISYLSSDSLCYSTCMNIPEPNDRILFGVTGDDSAHFPRKIDYWAKFEGKLCSDAKCPGRS